MGGWGAGGGEISRGIEDKEETVIKQGAQGAFPLLLDGRTE